MSWPRTQLSLTTLTETTATAGIYPPGTLAVEQTGTHPTAIIKNHGDRVWRYVKNSSGGAYAVGNHVHRKIGTSATGWETVLAPATRENPILSAGVVQHVIPDTHYGWVLVEGAGRYLAGTGGTTIDQILIQNGTDAGTFASQSATTAETTVAATGVGIVLTAATATNTGYAYFLPR